MTTVANPNWVTRGKTIRQLIEELKTFSDQDMDVLISSDNGKTIRPISLVKKSNGHCLLVNVEMADPAASEPDSRKPASESN